MLAATRQTSVSESGFESWITFVYGYRRLGGGLCSLNTVSFNYYFSFYMVTLQGDLCDLASELFNDMFSALLSD